ncbi:MAG: UDP-N-acetylmuramate dehydrogenase [Bacteroidales bacterium]
MYHKIDYSLVNNNTFHIPASAKHYVEYETKDELREALKEAHQSDLPILHIGEGSNLLFTNNYPGYVLHSAIRDISIIDESDGFVTLRVGAGLNWDRFVEYVVLNGWYGAENLSLIPGEVGASAVQNIGAYGVEVKDIIEGVESVNISDGEDRYFTLEECEYAYRSSIFKTRLAGEQVITHVIFKLSKEEGYNLGYSNLKDLLAGESPSLDRIRELIIEVRRSKLPDPTELGNAGSFFMNPYISIDQFNELKLSYPSIPHYPVDETRVKVPAGWLIEQCGWKGQSRGRAAVHSKQALVIVNLGGAIAQEIVDLAKDVIASVEEKFNISLKPEVIYI